MIETVLYPNTKILCKFYQNNSDKVTNMQRTFMYLQSIGNEMVHLKDQKHHYDDSSDKYCHVWNDIEKFDQFVRDTMNKPLLIEESETKIDSVSKQNHDIPK